MQNNVASLLPVEDADKLIRSPALSDYYDLDRKTNELTAQLVFLENHIRSGKCSEGLPEFGEGNKDFGNDVVLGQNLLSKDMARVQKNFASILKRGQLVLEELDEADRALRLNTLCSVQSFLARLHITCREAFEAGQCANGKS